MSALPAAGTTWHLKAVSGILGATCPSLPTTPGNVPAACSNYSYTPPPARPAYVPGLTYKLRVTRGFEVAAASGDLTRIHTVPDPYYNHSGYETAGRRGSSGSSTCRTGPSSGSTAPAGSWCGC